MFNAALFRGLSWLDEGLNRDQVMELLLGQGFSDEEVEGAFIELRSEP